MYESRTTGSKVIGCDNCTCVLVDYIPQPLTVPLVVLLSFSPSTITHSHTLTHTHTHSHTHTPVLHTHTHTKSHTLTNTHTHTHTRTCAHTHTHQVLLSWLLWKAPGACRTIQTFCYLNTSETSLMYYTLSEPSITFIISLLHFCVLWLCVSPVSLNTVSSCKIREDIVCLTLHA